MHRNSRLRPTVSLTSRRSETATQCFCHPSLTSNRGGEIWRKWLWDSSQISTYMLFLSLHLKLYPPSEKSINYFTRGRQAPETPKTEGNIIPPPLITMACSDARAHTQSHTWHAHTYAYLENVYTYTYMPVPPQTIHVYVVLLTILIDVTNCRTKTSWRRN